MKRKRKTGRKDPSKQKEYVNECDLPYENEAMRAHAKLMVFPIGQPNDAYAQYFVGNSYLAPVSTDQVGSSM